MRIMNTVLSGRDFFVRESLFLCTFENVFVMFFKRKRKEKKEKSNERLNEFAGHKWFIVEREWVRERDRISKPFSYFQNGVGNQQLDWAQISDFFLPFHTTQRPNPRTTWATNVDRVWDHHSMCQTLLTTHKTHWLQLYEVKMAQKGRMWRRCPQSFLPKKGCSIWAFNAKIKPKGRAEWIGSLLLFQSPSGTALFCFSTTDPCDLLCRSVTEKCGAKKKK